MIECFNERKWVSSEAYHFDTVMRNAKRSKKISFSLRKSGSNSLWWTQPFSPILQISCCAPLPATLRALARLSSPRISSCRPFHRSCTGHYGWNRPHREYPVPNPQWTYPSALRANQLSPPRHFRNFPMALRPQDRAPSSRRCCRSAGGSLLMSAKSASTDAACANETVTQKSNNAAVACGRNFFHRHLLSSILDLRLRTTSSYNTDDSPSCSAPRRSSSPLQSWHGSLDLRLHTRSDRRPL